VLAKNQVIFESEKLKFKYILTSLEEKLQMCDPVVKGAPAAKGAATSAKGAAAPSSPNPADSEEEGNFTMKIDEKFSSSSGKTLTGTPKINFFLFFYFQTIFFTFLDDDIPHVPSAPLSR
jgi:hypothetical protein